MTIQRVITVGIASYEAMKARTLDIAAGRVKPGQDEPRIWFTSIESMAQTLNGNNQALLAEIRKIPGRTVSELAKATDRQPSNLSRTLDNLVSKGLVRMDADPNDKRRKIPVVDYDGIQPSVIDLLAA